MAKSSSIQGRGSIWSKRRLKSGNRSRDGGGKQLKRRSTFASVHCEKHGVLPSDGKGFRSVSCPVPTTRKQKYLLGCPVCYNEARVKKE